MARMAHIQYPHISHLFRNTQITKRLFDSIFYTFFFYFSICNIVSLCLVVVTLHGRLSFQEFKLLNLNLNEKENFAQHSCCCLFLLIAQSYLFAMLLNHRNIRSRMTDHRVIRRKGNRQQIMQKREEETVFL